MKLKKAGTVLLSASLIFSLTGCTTNTQPVAKTKKEAVVETNSATGNTLVKDETVYVMCNGNGGVNHIIVSDWIKNGTKSNRVCDTSNLSNIEVVKGDSEVDANGKDLVWKANQGDIYYQGESKDTASLPVSMKVTYTLDGKEIAYDDLEGKTGKLKIRIDYTNYAKETVKVNGKNEELYIPFIMLSGLLADDTYRNLKVSNGKVVDIEDNQALMGFALPGLSEDLGFLGDKVDIPDYVEITADVKEVTKPVILTMASNSLLNEVDLDQVEDVDDLKKQMNQLDDGFHQLMDGSSALYEGMGTLMQSSKTLTGAIDALNNGTIQLKDGSEQLYGGAKLISENLKTLYDGQSQLGQGIATLNEGLATLSSNSKALNDGAHQIFQAVLNTVQTQVQAGLEESGTSTKVPALTPENYETVLTAIIAGINSEDGEAYAKARELAKTQITAQVYSEENQKLISAGVDQALAQGKTTAAAVVDTKLADAKQQASQIVDLAFLKCALESTDPQQIAANLPAAIQALTANPESAKAIQNTITSLPADTQQALMAALENFKENNPSYDTAVNSVVTAGVNKQYGTSFTAIGDEEKEILINMGVLNSVNTTYGTSFTSLEEAKTGLVKITSEAKVAEILASDKIKAQIRAGLSEASKPICDAVSQCDQVAFFVKSLQQYTNGVDTAYAGSGQLMEGSDALRSGTYQLYEGSKTLTSGASDLNDGITKLHEGTKELNEKVQALPEGVQKLTDGSMQLSDGLDKMYDEGISKVMNLVNGDLEGLMDRFNAIKDITTSYNNYSGLSKGMEGTVKFILKIGE